MDDGGDWGALGDLHGAYVMHNGGGGVALLALLAWGLCQCEGAVKRANPDKPKAVAAHHHHLHHKARRSWATNP